MAGKSLFDRLRERAWIRFVPRVVALLAVLGSIPSLRVFLYEPSVARALPPGLLYAIAAGLLLGHRLTMRITSWLLMGASAIVFVATFGPFVFVFRAASGTGSPIVYIVQHALFSLVVGVCGYLLRVYLAVDRTNASRLQA